MSIFAVILAILCLACTAHNVRVARAIRTKLPAAHLGDATGKAALAALVAGSRLPGVIGLISMGLAINMADHIAAVISPIGFVAIFVAQGISVVYISYAFRSVNQLRRRDPA